MPSECLPMLQFDGIRVTRQNVCGVNSNTGCDYATSESVVTLAMTKQYQDRQEYLQLNGRGRICVDQTVERQLRWIDWELTLCNVDPDLVNIITGEPLVLSDAVVPVSIGWSTTETGPLNSFFGMEMWVNTGDDCPAGVLKYGYMVMPRNVGATVNGLTLENGNINVTISGRTKRSSPWALGPYNVRIIEAVLNLGLPAPLLTAITTAEHMRQFWTALGPPPGACGCQDITPTVIVLPLVATAATVRTMTIPLDANGVSLPGYITWGDLTAPQLVAAGVTSATHSYAIGSYTASFRTTAYSAPVWTSATITAS